MFAQHPSSTATIHVLSTDLSSEGDLVTVRQRTRQIAALLRFGALEQASLATAVSEIARNAYQYARGGRVDFEVDLNSHPQFFWIQVSDKGPGMEPNDHLRSPGLGIPSARRLTDKFEIVSYPGRTSVRFGKNIPATAGFLKPYDMNQLVGQLTSAPTGLLEEVKRQSTEWLDTLELLETRETELQKRQQELERLRVELEETNRGVVALYAELEEKATELRRADQLKSQFLSHVSHEFRTPMNSVLALSTLLLRRVDGDLTPEQEKQVNFIHKAASDLTEMVNDLLDLAKVESGKLEVRLASVEVGQLLGAVRALMRPLVTNDAVDLVFEGSANLELRTDEGKVSQILRNLISNALKFTEQGEVRISSHLAASGDAIAFSVKDTGIGIPEEHLSYIFQEFSQVSNRIQKRVIGTGLGLSLSLKLATLLGGTLSVSSEVGAGSEFVLTLPLATHATEQETRELPQASDLGPILIIDDDETARYISTQLFRGSQHPIVEASSGSEGAERARFEKPVLIVLDLMMPGKSGFQVLEELKADPSTRAIPVVIQTSKRLTTQDIERLGRLPLAVISKSPGNRTRGLLQIRRTLQEPHLFSVEPEFQTDNGRVVS